MRSRTIGRIALKAARKSLAKKGPGEAALIEAWPDIAGAQLAPYTFPVHLNRRSNTLTVRVSAGRALEVQHLEPELLSRIATYCGARTAERLKIVQGPLPRPRPAEKTVTFRPLTEDERQRIAARTEGIADARLKAALQSLGERLAAKSPPRF